MNTFEVMQLKQFCRISSSEHTLNESKVTDSIQLTNWEELTPAVNYSSANKPSTSQGKCSGNRDICFRIQWHHSAGLAEILEAATNIYPSSWHRPS